MQDYSGYSGYGQPPSGDSGPAAPWPPVPPPPRRRVGLLSSYIAVALAAGALGAGTVVALYHPAANSSASAQPSIGAVTPPPLPRTAVPTPSGGSGTSGLQGSLTKVTPGIVDINTQAAVPASGAAGTAWSSPLRGLVLTNNHVIDGSTSIHGDGRDHRPEYTATVVGYDATARRGRASRCRRVRTCRPSRSATPIQVKLGDSVVALGNAGGQGGVPRGRDGTGQA